jgi:hypothetical protein
MPICTRELESSAQYRESCFESRIKLLQVIELVLYLSVLLLDDRLQVVVHLRCNIMYSVCVNTEQHF